MEEKDLIPPWNLSGDGFILIYNYPKHIRSSEYFENKIDQSKHFKGLGMVMLVDYNKSTSDPYKELLFIPGRFKYDKKNKYSITKIAVSTQQSVEFGRKNWGIPKTFADFSFNGIREKVTKVCVEEEKSNIFNAEFKAFGPKFPLYSWMMPIPLVQKLNNKIYHTQLSGKGWGQLAKLKNIETISNLFPDLKGIKPLLIVKVHDFSITFPVPTKIENLE